MRNLRKFALVGVSAVALSTPVFAQDVAPADAAEQAPAEEIVVTGTLVRGAAPTGSSVIGVDRAAIQATGASTVTQLLQSVPQLQSFNTIQAPVGGTNAVTTNRPNLRNLPSSNLSGGASTLILVDGHRVVGMGIQTTSPDLDTIAPGAIERVDIVPDGGSSIYGADAVGGVINFITRKTFNGVAVDGRFGFADNYKTWDANATVGKTWDGGGAYISYNYSQHDALFGRDRDWVRQYPTQTSALAVPTAGIECRVPNIQTVNAFGSASTNIYGLPFTPSVGAKLNQPNQCDYSDGATVYPEERRHSFFVAVTQDLSDSVTFDVKSFFMDRKQQSFGGPFHTNKSIGTSAALGQLNSPFRSSYIIGSPTEGHRVSFAWGPEDATGQTVHLQTWGISPTITAKLGGGWQARALVSYGESTTETHARAFNDTALNNAIVAGSFNPYAPTTSDAAALATIANWETFGRAKQTQFQARVIVDGSLFELPGGAVKIAVGAEYLHETLDTQKGNTIPGRQDVTTPASGIMPAVAALPFFTASRDVKSVFGEIVAPILSDVAGFQELTFSASGRYDNYSDFGNTFNPKFGLTWKPVEPLRIKAQWGKSFSAPSLANSANADPKVANYSSGFVFNNIFVPSSSYPTLIALGYTPPSGVQTTILTVGGGSNALKPQTAQTWSVGADLDPFEGARLSLTYWNVKYENLIGSPQGTHAGNASLFYQQFLNSYVINPDNTTLQDALAGAIVNGTPCAPQPQCVYVIGYHQTQNLGKFRQAGLDFSVSYGTETGFGSIDLSWAGTYLLHRQQSISATAPLIDQFPAGFSRLSWRTQVGANIGKLRAQAAWMHTHGYDFTPGTAALAGVYPAQNRIGSFNTVDLFFKYDFEGEGALKDLALTLNVNNLFDTDPPVRYIGGGTASQYGYANGSTVGRLVQLGFSKKF